MSEIYFATEAFAFTSHTGVPRVITPGEPINSDDPDFKGREHLFKAAADFVPSAKTETASAAPGERRFRSRPTTKDSSTAKEDGS